MSPTTVRRAVAVVFVGGIAGMIAMSIADNNGGAVTFGLVTAVAALCLIVVTAVTNPAATGPRSSEALAEDVEGRIERLVAAGADEAEVRALVGDAVRLGRSRGS